eukprot:SM000096S24859  [mRNA]  locus=s96:173654:175979:- [translate_table: standard]
MGLRDGELVLAGMNFTCLLQPLTRLEVPDRDCAFTLLAKALGYAIVLASTIVKAPQIYIILKNKSVQGLSAASFEMELVGFTIALSYCFFKKIPFSAYGELLPLLVQGLILVGLVYRFSPKLGPLTWLKAGVYCAAAPPLLSGNVSEKVIDTLFACQHAIFFLSRFPQIIENFRNKSTGQLSFATSFMNLAGCLVRLFTSIQERAPATMVLGACLGIITHGTVFSQILMYSKPAPKVDKVGDKKSE